jgi:hypothetical protein
VPVQRFILAAAWTALLLDRESSAFSFWPSAAKLNSGDMGLWLPKKMRLVQIF